MAGKKKKFTVRIDMAGYDLRFFEATTESSAKKKAEKWFYDTIESNPEYLVLFLKSASFSILPDRKGARKVEKGKEEEDYDPSVPSGKPVDGYSDKISLEADEVLVRCYDRWEVWNRDKAIRFYRIGALECCGAEKERYTNIFSILEEYPDVNAVTDDGEGWHHV